MEEYGEDCRAAGVVSCEKPSGAKSAKVPSTIKPQNRLRKQRALSALTLAPAVRRTPRPPRGPWQTKSRNAGFDLKHFTGSLECSLHDTTQATTEKSYEQGQESARNSYSSMTAATAILPLVGPPSTRSTRPLQRTRILSVSVISGGRVNVKSMPEPA